MGKREQESSKVSPMEDARQDATGTSRRVRVASFEHWAFEADHEVTKELPSRPPSSLSVGWKGKAQTRWVRKRLVRSTLRPFIPRPRLQI